MCPHISGHQAGSITNVMLRARAVSGAITSREAEESETMRASGYRSPRSANYAHKNKQRRELRQDSTKRQVQVQTHSPRTRHRMVCVAHTRTRTSGRKVQKTSARRHSLSAWAENDGVSRVLHGSLRRESQLCRLPKQQRATPHGQDSENDGKAIREFNRTQYKYDPLRSTTHLPRSTTPTQATPANTTTLTQQDDPDHGNLREIKKGGKKKAILVHAVFFLCLFPCLFVFLCLFGSLQFPVPGTQGTVYLLLNILPLSKENSRNLIGVN